jgi:hypothetical protein
MVPLAGSRAGRRVEVTCRSPADKGRILGSLVLGNTRCSLAQARVDQVVASAARRALPAGCSCCGGPDALGNERISPFSP